MKALFTALLLLNLGLVAYTLLAPPKPGPDNALIGQQLNADQIRIMPPQSAVVPRTGVCLRWGPFREADLEGVRRELARSGLGSRATETQLPAVAGWWVFIPPLKDRAEVDRKLGELQALGLTDYFAVEGEGPMRNAISLGSFKTEEGATAHLADLREKGVRSARVGPREQRAQTVVVVTDPDAQASARLAELAVRFPASELRSGECPKGQ